MSNVERLKKYLIGNDEQSGYLYNEISYGKVIMLSGEWGSGKTHFWYDSEQSMKSKLDEKLKANIYVSLYGKTSIQEIESEVFTKAYYKSKGKDNDEKDAIEKLSSTFSRLSSYIDDVSPVKVTPVVDFLKDLKGTSQQNGAEKFMKNGLIVCFDDFERKSSEINLNDLFGFITNLSLQYKATIIIILNDDVFESKEKTIFSTVKEKTVSKYLKFSPKCEELFEIIFKDKKYEKIRSYEINLKKLFCEVGIINARILIQLLDNLLEWIPCKIELSDFYLRYFVLANINFILNHYIFEAELVKEQQNLSQYIANAFGEQEAVEAKYKDSTTSKIKSDIKPNEVLVKIIFQQQEYSKNFITNLKVNVQEETTIGDKLIEFINGNEPLIKSLHFMNCFNIDNHQESNTKAEVEILNKINIFIETGII